MPSKQSNKFSLLDPLPVHSTLYIFAESGKYVAHMLGEGGAFHFEIHLTHDDIKDLNTMLQDALQEVGRKFERKTRSEKALLEYEKALQELALQGNYAFRRIFAQDINRISLALAGGTGKVVQIVSDSFFVPWDLLYDGPLGAGFTIDGYWGTRYCIRRSIEEVENVRGYLSPFLETLRPKVGLITSDKLSFVISEELPALDRLHKRKKIELFPLRALSKDKRSEEFQELDRFLRQELHFLHFACHAYEGTPLDRSYLSVTEDFSISMIDFTIGGFNLDHNPFVILNACRTGVTNPLYTSSWVRKLWEHGARGVLATDFKVLDRFASAFSDVLYHDLLRGASIGHALLNARWHFWIEERNPLGLAYALFSPPSIKVVKPRNS